MRNKRKRQVERPKSIFTKRLRKFFCVYSKKRNFREIDNNRIHIKKEDRETIRLFPNKKSWLLDNVFRIHTVLYGGNVPYFRQYMSCFICFDMMIALLLSIFLLIMGYIVLTHPETYFYINGEYNYYFLFKIPMLLFFFIMPPFYLLGEVFVPLYIQYRHVKGCIVRKIFKLRKKL